MVVKLIGTAKISISAFFFKTCYSYKKSTKIILEHAKRKNYYNFFYQFSNIQTLNAAILTIQSTSLASNTTFLKKKKMDDEKIPNIVEHDQNIPLREPDHVNHGLPRP